MGTVYHVTVVDPHTIRLTDSPLTAGVDRRVAFDRYFLNFTHDTEHYGQIKYLTGLWQRRNPA